MTQLLQDVFIVENLQVLTEGKSNDTMKIKGVFGRCNEKNNNGRIYPTNVLEGQLQKVQPLIEERRLCGELDHPQNDTVKLSNASHLITKLEMKGNELIGEAEILKTPAGLTAKALVEGGVKIGISSRGMGTLSEDAKGNKIVNEDFRLVTFDLVADPSTRGAFPGLSESTQSQFARESQSKLQKESNFVTMLQSKLREAYDPWIEEAKDKKKKGKGGPTDDDGDTTDDSLDPVGQGDADMDNDGDSDSTDKYLKNRREAIGKAMKGKKKKKMMEAVKAEGSYHQIAYALVEAFADQLDKAAGQSDPTKRGNAAQDTGSILGNMRARSNIKKSEIARAKGIAKGEKIRAKGDVKTAKIRQKAVDRAGGGSAAASDKPAGGGVMGAAKKAAGAAGKVAGAAGKAAGAVGGAAKAAAGAAGKAAGGAGELAKKGIEGAGRLADAGARGAGDLIKKGAEGAGGLAKKAAEGAGRAATSDTAKKAAVGAGKGLASAAGAVGGLAKKAAEGAGRAATSDTAKKAAAGAVGAAGAAGKGLRGVAGRASKAISDRLAAAKNKPEAAPEAKPTAKTPIDKSKVGEFNAPTRAPKKDPVNPDLRARAASLRDKGNAPKLNPNIAGPKGKLPEWTAYKRLGFQLAEAFGLTEGSRPSHKGGKKAKKSKGYK